VLEEMIQNGVGAKRIRVELYNLADSLGFQIIEIPSGNLLLLCFDEYLLQTAIPSQLLGSLQNPIQRTLVINRPKRAPSRTFGQARQQCLASQFFSRNAALRRTGKFLHHRYGEGVQRPRNRSG